MKTAAKFALMLAVAGGLYAVTALADRAPPPTTFVKDGKTYSWGVAHGVTGSLSVAAPYVRGAAPTDLVLSCSGLKSGGVQARFYSPKPNTVQLRVRTDDAVFRVRNGIEGFGGYDWVEGHGDMPEGYLKSLASTSKVSVEYAGQVTTFPGPGKALAENFGRACAELAQRASRDE